ncbi:MAG: CHAT domain-containing protein [Pseudomonadota bacterium]
MVSDSVTGAPRQRLRPALLILLALTAVPLKAAVLVLDVQSGQAAAQAGIVPGDVLLSWARQSEQRPLDWPLDVLLAEEAGSRLSGGELTVKRGTESLTLNLEPGVWGMTTGPLAADTTPRAELLRRIPELTAGNLETLLPDVSVLSDPAARLAVLWQAGDHFRRQRDLASAERPWTLALAATNAPAQVALLKARLGEVLTADARLDEALSYFHQALEFWQDLPAPQHEMQLHTRMGFTYFDQRQLPAAEAAFTEAIAVIRNTPARQPLAASALRGLGQISSIRGRFDEAITLGNEALELARDFAPHTIVEAKVINFLGYTVARTHDVTDGEALIREAIALADELEPGGVNSAGFRNNLAFIYYLRQDYGFARSLYVEALTRFEARNPVSPVVARTRYNIALTLSRQQRHAEAAEMLATVLQLQRQLVPGTEDEARTLHSLSFTYEAAGDMAKAIANELEAVELYREILPDSYLTATALHKLGQLYLRSGNLAAAGSGLEEALEMARRIFPESQLHAEAAFDLGELHSGEGSPALPLYREAVDIVESLQARLGGGDGAVSRFRDYYGHFFRRLIEAELEEGNTGPAFAVSERYRAQSFLAVLGSRPAALTSRLPEDMKRQWQSAQSDYEAALKAAAEAGPDGDLAMLAQTVLDARQKWRSTGDELRSTGEAGAVIAPQAATPAEVAKSLGPGHVLISYVSQPGHTDTFLIDADGQLSHHQLPLSRQELAKSVGQLRVLMAVPDMGAAGEAALKKHLEDLGEDLIAPLLPVLGDVSRLIVVPDGELWLTPIAALIVEDAYLLERFEVQLGWSATAFQQERPPADEETLLAFADPGALTGPDSGSDLTRDVVPRNGSSLPGARREVTQIARHFREPELFLDSQASESNFRKGAGGADVLHVAAHAVTQVDPPMESYLQLKGDEQHDGRLMAWEVLENLDLKAQLVTLSGCATALGEGAGGEGLMGLTRAFGVAGAQRVLASLWPVSDRATAGLMTSFYEHRAAGMDDVQALRQAQLEFLRPSLIQRLRSGFDNSQRHPFFWAAFSLYGAR